MGADFNSFATRAKNDADAIQACRDYIDECAWECGHGGYTGTMAEATGVTMTTHNFTDLDEACEWLMDNAEKWGPALGVTVTLDGEKKYLFGAWCSS